MTGTAPAWLARLAGHDGSPRLALAALLRSADAEGVADLHPLLLAYREAYLRLREAETGHAADRMATEGLREHLVGSVLPRLADEGWLLPGAGEGWRRVRASAPFWAEVALDREGAAALLEEAARQEALAGGLVRPDAAAQARGSLLEGRGLAKSFKGRRVVDDVSLALRQGEIVGLLGPNGAGKTTTFYLLVGLIGADAGRVLLDGDDITRAPMYRRARRGIGYLAQEPSIFRKMTVEENVRAILETRGLSRAECDARLERVLDELGIRHLRRSPAYALSGGERRRLEITRALVSEPKFMLLDEPFAGVDPIAVHDIQTIVAGLRHRGIGVLITDHNVEQTLDIVDRAYIMFEGRVQAAGSVRELVADDQVSRLYFGPTLTARLRARLEAGL